MRIKNFILARPWIYSGLPLSALAVLLSSLVLKIDDEYGFFIFCSSPILLGAFYFSIALRKVENPQYAKAALILSSLYCFCFAFFALEGVICLLMASPLLWFFIYLGLRFGRLIHSMFKPNTGLYSLGGLLLLSLVFDLNYEIKPVHSIVESSVVVSAPIEEIWNCVVAFPEITAEPEWFFKAGIAYPINARIEGEGVGAIRHCNFSTGPFVEPITVWDKPTRLAFDVTENPNPMTELSIYENVTPPHLHGFIVSEKGSFDLIIQEDDTVKLIGTTHYYNKLWPAAYWNLFSDNIIHKIHYRVLGHIKETVENKG